MTNRSATDPTACTLARIRDIRRTQRPACRTCGHTTCTHTFRPRRSEAFPCCSCSTKHRNESSTSCACLHKATAAHSERNAATSLQKDEPREADGAQDAPFLPLSTLAFPALYVPSPCSKSRHPDVRRGLSGTGRAHRCLCFGGKGHVLPANRTPVTRWRGAGTGPLYEQDRAEVGGLEPHTRGCPPVSNRVRRHRRFNFQK